MNFPTQPRFTRPGLLLCIALLVHPSAHAQGLPASTNDAAALARYDRNRNGVLDPEELAAQQRDAARIAAAPVSAKPNDQDEIVSLSPFQVSGAGDRGYYAANTMSATRLNSKIEDLASSITVVTKEQMADFAMLDINDIFAYEAGTEGTGNFTDFVMNASGNPIDNTQVDPTNANRIRGVGSANVSLSNFETSRRVPIDPINIDAVEISRGPNSNIFGLGDAAGTVNMVASSANLSRNRSQVQFRGDSFDGYRASVDLNRVIRPRVLSLRGSAVYQHDGYHLKPSGTDTVRLNGMVKFQPFKSTTLSASFSTYRLHGNRPNATMPRDGISFWQNAGSPTWDPMTQTTFINGQVFRVGGALPNFFQNMNQTSGRGASLFAVDRGVVGPGRRAAPRWPTIRRIRIRPRTSM
jgi:outer membrane receptor for ferric coprogen and ferric-rhodotorulic acid